MSAATPSVYDDDYTRWKAWEAAQFGVASASDRAYFDCELAAAGIEVGAALTVLEIGFGNGALLMHLSARGASTYGTEANPELLARASAAGIDARHADMLATWDDNSFDAVVAFDVLEHVPQDMLPALLIEISRILRPGGRLLARFPNGDSPLGLALQNGDVSHVTTIGSAKARFLFERAGFSIVRMGRPAQPLLDPDPRRTIYNLAVRPLRAVVERIVKLLWFAGTEIHFFSGNLVVVGKAGT